MCLTALTDEGLVTRIEYMNNIWMIYFTFILFCEWSKQLYRPSFSTRPDLHSGSEVSTYDVPLCYLPSLQLHLPATSTIVSHPLVSPTPVATVYLHLEIPPWFDSKCRWKKKKKNWRLAEGPEREKWRGARLWPLLKDAYVSSRGYERDKRWDVRGHFDASEHTSF